uniref:Uncharacterized protein n=1 Tax=Romanomermis culicivorax TaxID=13658 RepID=A0A915K310_ROMCU
MYLHRRRINWEFHLDQLLDLRYWSHLCHRCTPTTTATACIALVTNAGCCILTIGTDNEHIICGSELCSCINGYKNFDKNFTNIELCSSASVGQFLQQGHSSLGGARWIVKDIILIASSVPSQWTLVLMAKCSVTARADKVLEGTLILTVQLRKKLLVQ